jgi:DNA ligase-1
LYSKWFSGHEGVKKEVAQQTRLKLQAADPLAKSEATQGADNDVDGRNMRDDDEDVVLPNNKRRKPTPKGSVKRRVIEDDDSDDSDVAKHEVLENAPDRKLPGPADSSEPAAIASAMPMRNHKVKEEDEEGSDVEDTAEARAQVLSKLDGSGKDPYPDWKPNDPVPYAALCTTFHAIEMTTKRLEILAHCSLFLRQVLRLTPDDLLETVLLMINKLGSDYTGLELGIGESLIMKAIGESTGRSLSVIKADQNEIGDLGLVAAKSRSNQPTMFKPKPLTVRGVFQGLKDIATIEGQGSQSRKVGGIKKLLSSTDAALAGKGSKGVDITKDHGGPSEAKYIVRGLEGKLRLGLAGQSVLVALAQAIVFHRAVFVAAQEGKKFSPPSDEAIAKGTAILKSVYR